MQVPAARPFLKHQERFSALYEQRGACANKPLVAYINNGVYPERGCGKSTPGSHGYPELELPDSVRAHNIFNMGRMYFRLLRIFTFTKPSAALTREAEVGPGPGGPM